MTLHATHAEGAMPAGPPSFSSPCCPLYTHTCGCLFELGLPVLVSGVSSMQHLTDTSGKLLSLCPLLPFAGSDAFFPKSSPPPPAMPQMSHTWISRFPLLSRCHFLGKAEIRKCLAEVDTGSDWGTLSLDDLRNSF